MEMNYENGPNPDCGYLITDTKEISAKNVMTMLLDFSTVFGQLVREHDFTVEFYKFVDEMYGHERFAKMKFIVESFPWVVCDAFLKFLHDSPRIHVTID